MQYSYKTVYIGATGEIVEKKSRFIATIQPAKTEEEAVAFIDSMKKKYYDASHNCSAYVIGPSNEINHCSDDGEPSKTAGRPMLDVLIKEDIHNAVAVVTRYFGGTLLGTGGLVRAYQGALKEGLSKCTIIEKKYGKRYFVNTDYNGIGKLLYITSTMELTVLDTQYTDIVVSTVLLPPEKETMFLKKMQEATNGQAVFTELDPVYYAIINDKVELFPNEV